MHWGGMKGVNKNWQKGTERVSEGDGRRDGARGDGRGGGWLKGREKCVCEREQEGDKGRGWHRQKGDRGDSA